MNRTIGHLPMYIVRYGYDTDTNHINNTRYKDIDEKNYDCDEVFGEEVIRIHFLKVYIHL